MTRRRCISEVGVQVFDLFATADAEKLMTAGVEQLKTASAEQLLKAGAEAGTSLEEMAVTQRQVHKAINKRRMTKDMSKAAAPAAVTASKKSQEDRLRQLRLELLHETAGKECNHLRMKGRIICTDSCR